MKYICKFTYTNSSLETVLLVLEPWAEEVLIAPGISVEVIGEGGAIGSAFELEYLGDRLIVYAWPESIASVRIL